MYFQIIGVVIIIALLVVIYFVGLRIMIGLVIILVIASLLHMIPERNSDKDKNNQNTFKFFINSIINKKYTNAGSNRGPSAHKTDALTN